MEKRENESYMKEPCILTRPGHGCITDPNKTNWPVCQV